MSKISQTADENMMILVKLESIKDQIESMPYQNIESKRSLLKDAHELILLLRQNYTILRFFSTEKELKHYSTKYNALREFFNNFEMTKQEEEIERTKSPQISSPELSQSIITKCNRSKSSKASKSRSRKSKSSQRSLKEPLAFASSTRYDSIRPKNENMKPPVKTIHKIEDIKPDELVASRTETKIGLDIVKTQFDEMGMGQKKKGELGEGAKLKFHYPKENELISLKNLSPNIWQDLNKGKIEAIELFQNDLKFD